MSSKLYREKTHKRQKATSNEDEKTNSKEFNDVLRRTQEAKRKLKIN